MTYSPPVLLNTDLDDWLQPILEAASMDEAALETLAKTTGALKRRRGVRSSRQLLQLLLWYVLSDASLRDVAAYSAVLALRLSDEALRQRFHRAEAFVVALMGRLFAAELEAPPGRRLLLNDATLLAQPGSKGSDVRCHTL